MWVPVITVSTGPSQALVPTNTVMFVDGRPVRGLILIAHLVTPTGWSGTMREG